MESSDKLDMSLDDIIANSKKQQNALRAAKSTTRRAGIRKIFGTGRNANFPRARRGGRGPRTAGLGQGIREPVLDAHGKWKKETSAGPRKSMRHQLRQRPTSQWPRQTYKPVTITHGQPPQEQYRHPPTDKLFLSNLEYRVSERDLLELFSQIGPLKRVRLNYDKSGRSLGTGEVQFEVPFHATMAERRLNGILIDSKPLVIHHSGNQADGQNTGPRTLSSGITVVDPNDEAPHPFAPTEKSGERKPMNPLKSAVVAAVAPDQPFPGSSAPGARFRSSFVRSGMYSDRMDIG